MIGSPDTFLDVAVLIHSVNTKCWSDASKVRDRRANFLQPAIQQGRDLCGHER